MKYVTTLLMVLLVMPAYADQASQKVIDCMRANLPSSLRVQKFELISTDRSSASRTLGGRIYAKEEGGLLRMTLRVLEPPDLAGSAYLLRETPDDEADEIYLSLPKVNRVRRITGSNASQSLFGTDFSYADIRQIQNAFTGGDAKLEPEEKFDMRSVHVLMQEPESDKESPYTRTRSWVDKQTCVVLKAEFFDDDSDKPRKRLTAPASALTKADKTWYLNELEMRDLKEGTHTTLKLKIQQGEKDLSQHYFNTNTFGIIAK